MVVVRRGKMLLKQIKTMHHLGHNHQYKCKESITIYISCVFCFCFCICLLFVFLWFGLFLFLSCVVCGKHRQASGIHGGGKTW
jgi:hypothetical protein